jgi:uncharacterized protein (DUF58 family)
MGHLLEPDLLGRLEQLQLGTRRRLAGRFAGEHRSPRKGTSLDFADHREYQRGDDPRRIDVGVWARLDQLLVRLYEADDDLTVRLLVDTSASMAGPKLRQAARIAAAVGFVALVRRDVVSVHTFPLDRPAPRFAGRHAAHALLAHLDGLTADGDTRFAWAVGDLLSRRGPPGLTVVLSDLLTAEWAEGLDRLPARGGDVTVVHVLDPDELRPSLAGDLDLVDAETGRVVPVSLAPEQLRAYEATVAAWLDEVEARAHHGGAAYVRVLSGDDLESLLLGTWREAGLLR